MTTDPQPELDLTETQKAYNVAHSDMFQLAAYGHHRYHPSGEALTNEGKRQQRDYNDRLLAARDALEAALLRLVAEHAETFPGERGPAWLRSLADDPAALSLLAVRPDERDFDTDPAVSSAVAQSAPAETALRDQIAALAEDLRYVLDYRGPRHAHERPGVWDTSGKPCEHCARLAVVRKNLDAYDADPGAVLAVPLAADRPAEEAYRLAVSTALRLGTAANWEAIRDRAEDLVAEVTELAATKRRLGLMVDEYGHGASTLSEKLQEARATNRRLNLRAQRLESELAAYRKAVASWDVGERGTYITHASLQAIGKAGGVDLLGSVRHLKHFERVEQAEAAIERVRSLHDNLDAETALTAPDDEITRGAAARKIAAALDGYTPPAAAPAVSSVGQAAHTTRSAGWRAVVSPRTLHAIAVHLDARSVSILRPESDVYAEWQAVAAELRRMADETQPAEARCGCPHPEGEHSVYGCADGCGCEWMPKRPPMDPVHILGIKADDETQQPTSCGPAPDQCDSETGELCAVHEREEAHAEGEHCLCGRDCDKACTCGSAGDAFVPIGHYADCPQATEPAVGAQQPKEADPPAEECVCAPDLCHDPCPYCPACTTKQQPTEA